MGKNFFFFKKKVKLGIIGHGFVGKATDWGFYKGVTKFIVDPKLGTTIKDLSKFSPEFVFVCVPTPMESDGSQNSKIIIEVFKELIDKCPNAIKVIKSTVLPSILEKLHKLDCNVIYNPEFLREKHAREDFMYSDCIILGGEKNLSAKVSKLYNDSSRCLTRKHIFTELKTASLIKYTINTFLATKVIFFNEIFGVFENLNTDDSWELFHNAISCDKRIGDSHMQIPGHDGKKGFGGACFPKDSRALLKYAEENNIHLSVLESAVKANNKIRSKYDELDPREREQNISFDDKI